MGILLLICIVSGFFFWKNAASHCLIVTPTGEWRFELSRTPEEHTRGLMNRQSLCENCGMLFVFDKEEPQAFWMKDTSIPLDMYFYNAQGLLVDKVLNMRPERETKDPMIFHSKPAQYVLEVEQGSPFPANSINILQCQ